MRIVKAEEELVEFDDGSYMKNSWREECCEYNYADFSILEIDKEIMAQELESVFLSKAKDGEGVILTFHGLPHKKLGTYDKRVFVPCYSMQNGWYINKVTVKHYNKDGRQVGYFHLTAEMIER